MLPMTVKEIAAAVHGVWWNPREDAPAVSEVCTDSRKLMPGCLFLPWVGEKFDGHHFIDAALDAGASDVQAMDDSLEITTEVSDFSSVRENLEAAGFNFLSAELTMIPQTTNEITDPETLEKIQKFLDMLDDSDDVQDVYHNGDLPEEEEEDD